MLMALQMFIRSTNPSFLSIHCCTLFLFDNQPFVNYFKNILIIYLKKFTFSNK